MEARSAAATDFRVERLRAMAEGMIPAGVAVVCRDAYGDVGALFAEEMLAISSAVPRRRAEFAAGRMAARAALGKLGCTPVSIPVGSDRAPAWPSGYGGSISHCRGAVVAAAVRDRGHIGIDVEEAVPLERELWDAICTQREMAWLKVQGGLLATVMFSAKEAVYKAQYRITGRLLEFGEVELALDQAGYFSAQVLGEPALSISGRFGISDEFVLSFAMVRS
jgi:enterobactin synthetase component D